MRAQRAINPGPRRGVVKIASQCRVKEEAQTGMGFKLCVVAPLGKGDRNVLRGASSF